MSNAINRRSSCAESAASAKHRQRFRRRPNDIGNINSLLLPSVLYLEFLIMSSSSESDDDFLFLLIGTVLNKRIKRKKKPRFWIHFIISERQNRGYFYTIYNEIFKNRDIFFNFIRRSREIFQELFSIIR